MATPYSFINPRMQTYQGLKSSVSLAGKPLAKFDILNAHIRDSVVLAGELVIIGDSTTQSCTSQEAYLMKKATEVHHMLLINGMEGDSYIVENYDFLQDVIDRTSIATGVVSDGWSRHLKSIESSLEEINALYKSHMSSGKLQNRELFFQKRALLEANIQKQLSSVASTGSGLGRNTASKTCWACRPKAIRNTAKSHATPTPLPASQKPQPSSNAADTSASRWMWRLRRWRSERLVLREMSGSAGRRGMWRGGS